MTIKEKILKRLHFDKSNFNTFLVFLLFTALLWLLMKFSKNYTHEIGANITYINIPEDKLLNKASDSVLNLVLTGNGFKLMNYRLFTPKIEVDLQKDAILKSGKGYFLTRQHRELLKLQLDYDGEIKEMSRDTLHVLFDVNQYKKIPVYLDASISYASGYASKEGLVLVPDSVVINGPAHLVDTTTIVKAHPIVLENVNANQDITVDLDLKKFSANLQVLPNRVQGILEVNKFTEGTLSLAIQLINAPKDTRITIFPKNVTVTYRVSLEGYKDISATDFKVVADYRDKDSGKAFIPLKVKKKAAPVQNLKLQEKQVQFVIVK